MTITTLTITGTDNRDPHTTTLTIEDQQGQSYVVDIDPIELFRNMVENCFDGDDNTDTSDLDDIVDFIAEKTAT